MTTSGRRKIRCLGRKGRSITPRDDHYDVRIPARESSRPSGATSARHRNRRETGDRDGCSRDSSRCSTMRRKALLSGTTQGQRSAPWWTPMSGPTPPLERPGTSHGSAHGWPRRLAKSEVVSVDEKNVCVERRRSTRYPYRLDNAPCAGFSSNPWEAKTDRFGGVKRGEV